MRAGVAMFPRWIFVFIFVTNRQVTKSETRQAYFKSVPNHVLKGHTYRQHVGISLTECVLFCLQDAAVCYSVNYEVNNQLCEMNDLETNGHDISYKWKALYLQAITRQVDQSKETRETRAVRLASAPLVTRTYPRSCKDLFFNHVSSGNGIYSISPFEGVIQRVYCHMDEIPGCGNGGWSIVMKINGQKQTFKYDSPYWSDKSTYNPAAANYGLDNTETKTADYWKTKFNKLCLGMKINSTIAWMAVSFYTNKTLFSLIADGVYRITFAGQTNWLNLVPGSTIQPYCNGEGFNVYFSDLRVRVGLYGSSALDCSSPGSFVGFGGGGIGCEASYVSCGNAHSCFISNRPKSIDAFGYILIQ